MNVTHMRLWPLGDYPTGSIDLVDDGGDVVMTVSAVAGDGTEPCVLIEDDVIHVLVDDDRVTKDVVRRELRKLSEAMSIKWVYVHSDEKLLEMLEDISEKKRGVSQGE